MPFIYGKNANFAKICSGHQ